MNREQLTLVDRSIEARLLDVLARSSILSSHVLALRLADVADGRQVRQVLAGLVERGVVARQAQRAAVWYFGYTLQPAAGPEPAQAAFSPALASFLAELAW